MATMTTATGSYEINVKRVQKTIEMAVRGAFTPEQAGQFHKDYEHEIGSIKADEFVLKVDCLDMTVITQDMIPKLQYSLEMYKKSGFKTIQVLINKSMIIKMQINRVARNAGLTNLEMVEQ
jgi:hypothetical protein